MKKIAKLLIALPFLILGAFTLWANAESEEVHNEFPGEVEVIQLDQSGGEMIGYVELE